MESLLFKTMGPGLYIRVVHRERPAKSQVPFASESHCFEIYGSFDY